MARLQRGKAAGHEAAELEQTGQIQAQQREQRRKQRHHRGRLQLKAPAQLRARRAQGQQQAAER
jgi:hypothetical protein